MTPRTAARIDSNQPALVAALRQIPGVSVAVTSQLGKGFPDIVVGYRGRNYIFEIKDPEQPPSKRRLTSDEQKWHDRWCGQVDVVTCLGDCLHYMKGVS